MHRIIARVCVSSILFWSLLLTTFRWLLIGFYADSLVIMILAQIIHALSFGAAHAGCIEIIRRLFRGSNAGQGQALYSAIGFGAGGALGAIIGGFLWNVSALLLFSVCAAAVLLAAIVAWFGLTESRFHNRI